MSSATILTIVGLIISNALAILAVLDRKRVAHDKRVEEEAMVPAKYFKQITDGQAEYIGLLEVRIGQLGSRIGELNEIVGEQYEMIQACERDKHELTSRVSELEAQIGRRD